MFPTYSILPLIFLALAAKWSSVSGQSTRVEYEIRRLSNAQGITFDAKPCDRMPSSPCDTKIQGYVDVKTADRAWPGSKGVASWPTLLQKKDENSPHIDQIVSEDYCTGRYQGSVLRLHVEDEDSMGMKNDFVDDFECRGVYQAAPSEMSAKWSEERTCKGIYQPANTQITYRVRAYTVDPNSCGRPAPSKIKKP